MFAEMLRRNVETKLNFKTKIAYSYAKAKQILEQQNNFFTALLDVSLPDAPRGEIIDLVTSHHISPIVFTGKFDDKIREQMFAKKIVDYILKDNVRSINNIIELLERLIKNQKTKILIAEDSPSLRSILVRLLTNYKFQVIDVPNGQVGLEVLTEHPDVKLVITDYNMPNMDGFVFTERIRQKYSKEELAIIGISDSSGSLVSVRFLKLGANDYLAKPFANEELYSRVIQNIEILENIQKLKRLNEIKNKFLNVVAKDLREPISAIKGFSELMLEGVAGTLNEEQKEYLGIIKKSSEDILSLVNSLLDLSAFEKGELEIQRIRFSLDKLVQEQVELFKFQLENQNITLEEEIKNVPSLLIDPKKITQTIQSLFNYALGSIPSGGKIFISLDRQDNLVILKIIASKHETCGDNQDQPLTNQFYLAETNSKIGAKTSDLELELAHKIIEAHNGQLLLQENAYAGTEVSVLLPVQ